jgi:hypothetical protein
VIRGQICFPPCVSSFSSTNRHHRCRLQLYPCNPRLPRRSGAKAGNPWFSHLISCKPAPPTTPAARPVLSLLPRLGSTPTLQVAGVTAAASTPFRLSVYADGPRPVKSCFHSAAAETTPAAQMYELELLRQRLLDFAGVVESRPALAAKQGVVCSNRRTPDSLLPLSIEV